MMEITTSSGGKTILIRKFKALDGWEIQNNFISFAASREKEFRKRFTMEILSYATVSKDGREIPLSTDALIDNHLESWPNVQAVFEGVLLANGIDPATHAERPDYWSNVGAEIATSFLASCGALIGPALENMGIKGKEGEE
jgi:hypothetical protein